MDQIKRGLNLYLVVSETLYEKVPVTDDGDGPLEPYSICELILAPSRGKAKWLAWKEDKSFNGDIMDMPKFRTRKILDGKRFKENTGETVTWLEGESRVVTYDEQFDNFWKSPTINLCLNKCNRENF